MKRLLSAAIASVGLATAMATPAEAVTRTWFVFGEINFFAGTNDLISAQVRGTFDFDPDVVFNPVEGFSPISNVNVTVNGYDEDVTEDLVYDGLYNNATVVQNFGGVPFIRLTRDLDNPLTFDTNFPPDDPTGGNIIGTEVVALNGSNLEVVDTNPQGTQVLFLALDEAITNDVSQTRIDLDNNAGLTSTGVILGECAREFTNSGITFCIGDEQQTGIGRNGPQADGMGGFIDLNAGFITTVIPVPAAAPLLLTGLVGLGLFARRRKAAA